MPARCFAAFLLAWVAPLAASCSSETQNSATSSGGSGGAGGSGGSGASGGAAGSTSTDASVDAPPNPCVFQGDAGELGKWPDSKTQPCLGTGCVGGGEGGDYLLNVPSYSVTGSVITDSVTGLQWRKDVIDDKVWSDAGPACAALNASDAGAAPWRLPTRLELISLLDFGAVTNLLQPVELDVLTKANSVWTSTEAKANSGMAWIVNFGVGNVGVSLKATLLPVRCVRGTLQAPKLQVNATCKVVSDVGTGLMWQQTSDTAQYTWQNAVKMCNAIEHAGTADWRLPSAKELMTIVLDSASQPAIDAQVFQGDLKATYWTSTPNLSKPGDARAVDFSNGASFSNVMTAAFRTRCVRSLP